ncbi:MAG: Txe/YoeB family addiction module toxin [Chitinophagaceae bacterium]|jgi:toxin YoeB|nr:MAG: Txe/YoeB family addiction module toxin [Chitinophagaceae bacterium]
MEIVFIGKSEKDIKEWKNAGDVAVLKRIRKLLESIQETPFRGIGKPEPLSHDLSGKWSRRINQKDRMVYAIEDKKIKVYSLKGHYEKS